VDWRAWPAAVAFLLSFLVSLHNPAASLALLSAANSILAINALVIGWAHSPSQVAAPVQTA
jgi:hypothetical protein